jgi:hypothetical protein
MQAIITSWIITFTLILASTITSAVAGETKLSLILVIILFIYIGLTLKILKILEDN